MTKEELIILSDTLYMLDLAEKLSIEVLTQTNNSSHWPETIGEHIVNFTIYPLLTHDWSDSEVGYVAEELTEELTLLDTGVNKPDSWEALFKIRDKLRDTLDT